LTRAFATASLVPAVYGPPQNYQPQYPPPVPHPWQQNPADATRPLGIAYIVYACFLGLAVLIVPLYALFFAAVFADAGSSSSSPGDEQAAEAIGGIMFLVFGLAEVLIIAKLTLVILAAQGLFKMRRYTICIVAAALSCLSMPLGTALGIWTFVVLTKPEVKAAFR